MIVADCSPQLVGRVELLDPGVHAIGLDRNDRRDPAVEAGVGGERDIRFQCVDDRGRVRWEGSESRRQSTGGKKSRGSHPPARAPVSAKKCWSASRVTMSSTSLYKATAAKTP